MTNDFYSELRETFMLCEQARLETDQLCEMSAELVDAAAAMRTDDVPCCQICRTPLRDPVENWIGLCADCERSVPR